VHDHRAGGSVGIEAFIEALQAQRVAMLALILLPRHVKAEAAHVALVGVGEVGSFVFARVVAVGYQGVEKHFMRIQIEHPQALFGRRQIEVDDRQALLVFGEAAGLLEVEVASQCFLKHLKPQALLLGPEAGIEVAGRAFEARKRCSHGHFGAGVGVGK